MSIQALSWAFNLQLDSPSQKLVLLALADHADEHWVCWPSQELLSARTAQSVSSVKRRLQELVEIGVIKTKRRARQSTIYQICKDFKLMTAQVELSSPMKAQTELMIAQNDDMIAHCRATEPSTRTTIIEPSKKDSSSSDWPSSFREDFWNAYPRHVEKKAALAKLEALKKSGEVKWQELIAGVMRYASAVAQTEVKYIKHPTTWLNRGCWSDEARAIAAKPTAKKLSFFDIALGRIEHDDERAKPH